MTDSRPAMPKAFRSALPALLTAMLVLLPFRADGAAAETPCFAAADPAADPLSLAAGVERDCSDIIAGLKALLSPTAADTVTLVSAYNNRANARQRLGDLEGGAEDFGAALDLDPSNWVLHLNRGTLMLLMKQPTAALADFQEAERLSGGQLPAAAFNATWAYRALGDIPAAEASLKAALSSPTGSRRGSPANPRP
jgi:tetratricopeptide (TPR) repeat protein